jgi:hypothetical protein
MTDHSLSRLLFNGIDATTGDYLLPAIDVQQLAHIVTANRLAGDELGDLAAKVRRARQKHYAVVHGVDPNDLAQAGWALVMPAVTDDAAAARQDAIRHALLPLRTLRTAQAAELYREYTGADGYRAGETKQQFVARLGAGPGPVQPKKVPYYLLLVATPDEIPFHIQYQLDVHYAVGRITFDAPEDYARYAQSVVDAETGRVTRRRHATLFGVANPGDPSTQLSAEHLITPLADHVAARAGWTSERHLADAATRDRLTAVLRDPPALLFTASHGMGFPSGDAAQRDRQGALLCQDWPGPGHAVARDHYFAGEDIPADADLRGMIGILFACYGGGTPMRDEFTRRALGDAHAKQLAPSSLVARLPQRLLGHGALAVVAHVDRAWGSTFLWVDAKGEAETKTHIDVFESVLDSVMAGDRIGHAMEALNLRYAELAADLSERIEQIQLYEDKYEDSELAALWIYNSDARNYAVLGDPAVRISDAPVRISDAPPAHDFGWLSGSPSPGEPAEPGVLARVGAKLTETLSRVVADLTTLEIKTYTSADGKPIAPGADLTASGARLRALTRCALDGDVETCVPTTATGEVDQAVWQLHLEMVKQAQAHRAELLKTVLSLFSPRA